MSSYEMVNKSYSGMLKNNKNMKRKISIQMLCNQQKNKKKKNHSFSVSSSLFFN